MSALETISDDLFNILYLAWKLLQPKCFSVLYLAWKSFQLKSEENPRSSLCPFQKRPDWSLKQKASRTFHGYIWYFK